MRTLRASEIGAYLYCRRAWWYRRRGHDSKNQSELAEGTRLHQQHGRAVFIAGCQRVVAYALFLAGLVLLTVVLTRLMI